MPKAKTTTERLARLQRLVDKAARGRERLRQTLIEKVGVDVRTWRPKKLTPAELRQEIRAANADAAAEVEREVERRVSARAHHGVDRVLRLADVLKLTALSRATIYRLEHA